MAGALVSTVEQEQAISSIVVDLVGLRGSGGSFDNDTSLWDLGFESIDFVRLLLAIEQHFSIVVPESFATMEYFRTVRSLAAMVECLQSKVPVASGDAPSQ
jgi:acyl carrier protein